MNDDYFTPELAEEQLKKIIPHLQKARQLKREIEKIAAGADYNAALLKPKKEKIARLIDDLRLEIDHIESLGAYLKDVDLGLIDFLSTFEGRDIFLCWRLGEEHIAYWHDIGEGFSSRQDIVFLDKINHEADQ